MIYKVRIERKVEKKLERITPPYYSKLKKAILNLRENPRPDGHKKLKGFEAYRIRVGNYRIIYEVKDEIRLIDIIDLGHRKEIYK
jgi:mRNA interferase RelE/StbE